MTSPGDEGPSFLPSPRMTNQDTYVLCQLAGADYGLRSADILHIDMLEHVTPVPNTAPAVEGVVFSRGQVIPALNLRARFGLEKAPHTERTRLIFMTLHQRTVALVVDSAREFRRIPRDAIRPMEETLHGIRGNYIQGVASLGDRMVLLIDVAAVLDLEETENLANVVHSAPPVSS